MSAIAARLADGRLHLQHGPIDLIVEAFGRADEVECAYGQAVARFGDILPTLVGELLLLRRPLGEAYPLLQGPVARRMAEATWPHRAAYITPMAAVAGAVADEMLQAVVAGRTIDKAYENDGLPLPTDAHSSSVPSWFSSRCGLNPAGVVCGVKQGTAPFMCSGSLYAWLRSHRL